ncbi:phospholipid/cholesterol/gamma-HCH transport system substrate-binding protein [Prauserella shujinwangii]|uniref:Phospholipid/cholesterol/gamma-HCH transport system substrate-binding protein n=1 Tax=Prauserella shujinwangii TaxID=1453103 RepID=A0A2T0LL39_9PSEU|nr:MlaD family protein [Prauserella shujinwangii]PRX43665.1 phospholipid/cholesterol/gamma-HCH transport system substrate-binding protein [Prauserella shujinwangii]
MLTRKVRLQVIAFVLVALAGISYVSATYVGLDRLVGGSGYVVRARLAESGGIFGNAEVTYRGVAIGRVGQLRLAGEGVEADLRIDDDAPPVPADVLAVVAHRSAVGEQYVDLRPRSDGAPYLADGSVIEAEDTETPLRSEELVRNLDRLVASVPRDDLRTVVDELYLATRDTGPSLQALLDATAGFTGAAGEHLPQTVRLITDAGTVLETQVSAAEALRDFGRNARLVARRLRNSDGDLRGVLSAGPAAAVQVGELLRESGPGLTTLLGNLLTTAEVIRTRHDGLEQLLVLTPRAVAAGRTVLGGQSAGFGLASTFFDPLPCTTGYEGTRYRDGLDTAPAPLNTDAHCVRRPARE